MQRNKNKPYIYLIGILYKFYNGRYIYFLFHSAFRLKYDAPGRQPVNHQGGLKQLGQYHSKLGVAGTQFISKFQNDSKSIEDVLFKVSS